MIRRLILSALVPAAAAAVLLMPAASASQVPAPPGEPAAYTALEAGDRFTCALAADGTARCWGFDNVGQLGIGDSVGRCEESIYAKGPCARTPQAVHGGRRFTSISAGDEHACAIDEAGDLYCWGHAHAAARSAAREHISGRVRRLRPDRQQRDSLLEVVRGRPQRRDHSLRPPTGRQLRSAQGTRVRSMTTDAPTVGETTRMPRWESDQTTTTSTGKSR